MVLSWKVDSSSSPLRSSRGVFTMNKKKKIALTKKDQLTTAAGRPVGDNQNSLTVGPRGPIVLEDFLLFEKMAIFNRERIPERVVHAKGSGAYGYFACTNELFYVKWHFKTRQGIKNFTRQEAEAMRGRDPDYAQRDLFSAID